MFWLLSLLKRHLWREILYRVKALVTSFLLYPSYAVRIILVELKMPIYTFRNDKDEFFRLFLVTKSVKLFEGIYEKPVMSAFGWILARGITPRPAGLKIPQQMKCRFDTSFARRIQLSLSNSTVVIILWSLRIVICGKKLEQRWRNRSICQ